MLMKYTEEIFNILSKGGFISSNSVSPAVKRYYDAIEEELAEYYEYYKGIGFYLEGGDGYYLFTRREAKVDLERKLEAAMKWIDYLSFLKTYDATFGPGFKFRPADIEVQISCQMELKEKAAKLFSDKKKYNEVVEKLVAELEKSGMIELETNFYEVRVHGYQTNFGCGGPHSADPDRHLGGDQRRLRRRYEVSHCLRLHPRVLREAGEGVRWGQAAHLHRHRLPQRL